MNLLCTKQIDTDCCFVADAFPQLTENMLKKSWRGCHSNGKHGMRFSSLTWATTAMTNQKENFSGLTLWLCWCWDVQESRHSEVKKSRRSHDPKNWKSRRNERERKRNRQKGFRQIDCQAETEMAQEHHKNKFAIIHFDLSLRTKFESFFEETHCIEPRWEGGGVQGRENLHFYFHFASF